MDLGPAERIDSLIEGTPLFAPFEGLPEELWKTQNCASCHQWDSAKLCDQAQTYVTRGASGLDRIQHPYGLVFKRAMANGYSARM